MNTKLPFEVAVVMIVPPVGTVLAWNDIVRRRDLSVPLRGFWVVFSLFMPIGPLLYLGIGKGRLW